MDDIGHLQRYAHRAMLAKPEAMGKKITTTIRDKKRFKGVGDGG
jgi:hypothetical protein